MLVLIIVPCVCWDQERTERKIPAWIHAHFRMRLFHRPYKFALMSQSDCKVSADLFRRKQI